MSKEFIPARELLPTVLKPEHKPLSTIQERLVSLNEDQDSAIIYQHSVLCQTCMPYRDPGSQIRAWQRSNGRVSLLIQAGNAYDANHSVWLDVGLPHVSGAFSPFFRLSMVRRKR